MFNEYVDDCYDYRECDECNEHKNTIDEIKYWVKSIIDLVYSDDNFEDFEVYLEELTHVLDMQVPQSSPNVCRKNKPIHPILKQWHQFNDSHLKSLVINK